MISVPQLGFVVMASWAVILQTLALASGQLMMRPNKDYSAILHFIMGIVNRADSDFRLAV